jgi:soluble lytic murein transglycosylase-like protein
MSFRCSPTRARLLALALVLPAVCTPPALADPPVAPVPPPVTAPWFDSVEDTGDDLPQRGGAAPRPAPAAPGAPSAALAGVPYRDLILRYAALRGLEPALVAAVVHQESGFNPRAVSRAGARGLMQLMPATARGMGARVSRLFDPATNLAYGTRYLAGLRVRFRGNVRLMAAAYNAGPNAVVKHRGVPPFAETRTYVARVTALRARYRTR